MLLTPTSKSKKVFQKLKGYIHQILIVPIRYWRGNWVHKLVTLIVALVLILTLFIAGIGEWYIASQNGLPMTYGVSFVPDYAKSLGLNPQQTMKALLSIGVRQFRLTSYWNDIQPTKGTYNFSQLNWEFALANEYHAKIILTVGLRQPRWPECHPAPWINTAAPMGQWEPELLSFMKKVITRYHDNPALEAWQLENEYFLKGFGDCTNFSRSRLISEYNLLTKYGGNHPIIIGRSNNAIGIPVNAPTPTIYGISIYKRVWDANITKRYIEYPFPSWFYSFLAGVQEIYQHKNMIILEMQAEAWPPDGKAIVDTSLKQQNNSMNATRLVNRFNFAKSTGMKDSIMWGAEYWYYRKIILHDPSMWNVAKKEFKINDLHTGEYLLTHPNS